MVNYHSFNTNFASKYGIEEAVIFDNLYFWCLKNKQNDINKNHLENDIDRYWTFNSYKAMAETFSYMNPQKIRRIIQHLVQLKFVVVGNFNKVQYDRTSWYAVTELGEEAYLNDCTEIKSRIYDNEKSIFQKCKMEDSKSSNRSDENDTPIPYTNKDTNKDTNSSISLSEYEAIKKENEELKKQIANSSSSKDSEKKTAEKKRYPKTDYDEVYTLHNKICKWLCDNNKLSSMPTYSYKVCNSVIKKAFDSFGKDKVLEGIKNAVKDRWCVEKSGFCITAILSEKVLFREINKQFYDPYQSNGRIEIKKGQSAFVDKERDFSNITNTEDIK